MKRLLPLIVIAAALYGCGKDTTVDPNVCISIDPTELTLRVGQSETISATVTPDDLPNKTVLWISANTSVAKVSGGKVTAVGAGTTTITAKTDWAGRTATCKVTVLNPVLVASIDLGSSDLHLDPKEGSYSFAVSVLPEDATDKGLDWSSSDESVVFVSDGVLTLKGKGSAVVTAVARDDGKASASCSVTVVSIPEAVDLGLSVKWASFNLGAEKPEDSGDFYAWGECSPKSSYAWSDYGFSSSASGPFSKYSASDGRTILDAEDDAASVSLGEGWRMPTTEEIAELIDEQNCIWEKATLGGRNGFTVTSLKEGYAGRSIFLPAAGYMENAELIAEGDVGNYWSATLSDGKQSHAMSMGFPVIINSPLPRCFGLSVRPVTE